MTRFILLTFGFLAWAFYEMSGGADFEPARQKYAQQIAAAEQLAQQKAAAEAAQTERDQAMMAQLLPSTDETEAESAAPQRSVSVSLTSMQATTANGPKAVSAPQPRNAALVSASTDQVPVNVDTGNAVANTPAIIPSLIDPNDTGAVAIDDGIDSDEDLNGVITSTVAATAVTDIRTVTGSRVNVRGGPGTEHNIVSRLEQGDAVEVLQDTGQGWVRMRPIDGGPEGWMADFLLTSG